MEPLAGRYVVAFKDPDTGDLVKALALNRTAAEMLRMHVEGHDIPSIAHALSEKYGAPAEQISLHEIGNNLIQSASSVGRKAYAKVSLMLAAIAETRRARASTLAHAV